MGTVGRKLEEAVKTKNQLLLLNLLNEPNHMDASLASYFDIAMNTTAQWSKLETWSFLLEMGKVWIV